MSYIDLTNIKNVYIGEWNTATYLIDDIQFTDVLARDLTLNASHPSGTYNDSFEVTLSASDNQDVYYTIDGSQPSIVDSQKYNGAIHVDDDTLLKAIVVDNGNMSGVYEFVYTINHDDNAHYTPVVVQTFEEGTPFTATTNATAEIATDQQHSGSQSLKYVKNVSDSTTKTSGSIKIDFNHAVDVSDLKYLIFYIKDTQGNNTMQISLIDAKGNESGYDWRSPSTVKNTWSQYYVKLSDISGIDKTQVTAMRIGQWNSGTYYIDDVYFDNYLSNGLPSLIPAQPIANVESGYRFKDTLSISLENDINAPMYYTLDGSLPTKDSQLYNGELLLTNTTTLKVVSFDNGEYSEIVELNYIKDENVISDVVTNKTPGKYTKAMSVTLSTDEGLDIYYTTDGSNPSNKSTKYTDPIYVNKTTTIKAVSYNGSIAGNIMTFEYKYPTIPSQVTASPNKLIFQSATSIELISDPDAVIYYTTDGSVPTVNSTIASGLISISQTMTIRAIAIRDGLQSEISTFNYIIAPEAVKADKPAGTYNGSVVVEFRVPSTDQVEIYYTTDGSDPTVCEEDHYTQPLKVSENTTFKVAATFKNSDSLGEISTYEYIINPITKVVAPVITPCSGTYGQRQLVSMSTDTVDGKIYYTLDGTTPTVDSQEFTSDFYVQGDTTIKAITVKDNQVSEVTENKLVITDADSPFLKTDGTVIRNNYGSGDLVQLKGTNIGGWLVMENWQCPTNSPDQKTTIEVLTERFGEEKAWELINIYQDNWFNEADFDILKEEGVNVLRLPISYFEMCNEDGSLKDTAFDRLDWFIEEAAKREIYTLIDMHGAFGSQNGKDHSGDVTIPDVGDFYGNEENIQKTIALWEAIAERYKGNEWVAGYDLLNEPSAVGTEQFEVYDRLYRAIRAIDQDHIIQIQAIWEPTHLPNPQLYGWENVVYQYHFYGWDVETDAQGQREFIESKVKFLEDTQFNVPVFVGEFTFFSNTASWDALDIFDEQGWSYTSWTYKVQGNNSSWGMYTINDNTKVDIYNDDYDTIVSKWSSFNFVRNTKYADILKTHFTTTIIDNEAPVITGNNNVSVTIGTKLSIEEILNLFVKDQVNGVIRDVTIETDFNPDIVGDYIVTVYAVDKSGNEAMKEFLVTVTEELIDSDDQNENNPEQGNQDKPNSDNQDPEQQEDSDLSSDSEKFDSDTSDQVILDQESHPNEVPNEADNIVNTGDNMNVGYYFAAGCIALFAILILIRKKRKG